MSKITLQSLTNLENEQSVVNTLNENFATITTAVDNTVSRDGAVPSTMTAALDMNSHSIINLPAPTTATEPLRLAELLAITDDPVFAIVDPGIVTHTGSNVYISRTLTGTANEITITNGTGASANPTISLPTALTFTGKTVTNGTFASPIITSATLTNPSINTLALTTLTNINLNALALGSQPAAIAGTVLRLIGENSAGVSIELNAYGGAPGFLAKHANGTAASPTASLINDNLARLFARGYGATAYSATSRASVNLAASQNWTDSAHGTYISFQTTADSTTTAVERMRIHDGGTVWISKSATALSSLLASSTPCVLTLTEVTGTASVLEINTYGATGGGICSRQAQGTAAAPTASQTGNILGALTSRGYGATAFSSGVRTIISQIAGENWSDTAQGTYIAFSTTANTTTTTSEKMRIHGSGGVSIGSTTDPGAGNLRVEGTLTLTGSVTSALLTNNQTGGFGYTAGVSVGGTVTQATSKSTAVTLNKLAGQITLNNAALAAATIVSFTLTNSTINSADQLLITHASGGTIGSYTFTSQTASGSAVIYVRNATAGSLSEAIVLHYSVIRSAVT